MKQAQLLAVIKMAFYKNTSYILFFPLGTANPRKASPNIRVRFPAETYALSGQTAQLECFAYGK